MAVTFIGDVHGWSVRLERILEQAEGEVVLLGDLVDRGPDAKGVLARVRELCEAGHARCILGNHEWFLLRSLGCAELGLEPDEDLHASWRGSFGGAAVYESFGAHDGDGLRRALGELLPWLAGLPWVADGAEGGRSWIAVHAGLDPDLPWAAQVAELAQAWRPDQGEDAERRNLACILAKNRVSRVPFDLPPGCTLVSGHVPLREAVVTPARIACDTSGGLPGRPLSAVIWPAGRVIRS